MHAGGWRRGARGSRAGGGRPGRHARRILNRQSHTRTRRRPEKRFRVQRFLQTHHGLFLVRSVGEGQIGQIIDYIFCFFVMYI